MKKLICLIYLICTSILIAQPPSVTPTLINDVCGNSYAQFRVQNPIQRQAYAAYLANSTTPIGFAPPIAQNANFYAPQFAIEGSRFVIGRNVVSVVGYNANIVRKVPNNLVTIDGVLNENWRLDKNTFFNLSNASPSVKRSPLVFDFLYDDNYIYFGVKVVDNTLGGDDKIEIYLDANNVRTNYTSGSTDPKVIAARQIVIPFSTQGTTLNLFSARTPTSAYQWNDDSKDPTGMIISVKTYSGLTALDYNNDSDQNAAPDVMNGTGFIVELAIPWFNFFGFPQGDPFDVNTLNGLSFGFNIATNDDKNFDGQRDSQAFYDFGGLSGNNWFTSQNFGTVTFGTTDPLSISNSLVGTVQVFGVQTPGNLAQPTIQGNCYGGLTITSSLAVSGTTNYWQTSRQGISNLDLAASSTSSVPKEVLSTAGISKLYLNAFLSSSGCWSSPTEVEIVPNEPAAPVGGNIITASFPSCGLGIFTSTITAAMNNLYYWQTVSGTGELTSLSANIPYNFTTLGLNSIYLRSLNTITGCWSLGEATESATIEILIPDVPAEITGSPAGACLGYLLTVTGAPSVTGENWYWQTTSTGLSKVSNRSSFLVTSPGEYFLRAENQGCWSTTVTAISVSESNVGIPRFGSNSSLISLGTGGFADCKKVVVKPAYLTNGFERVYWQTSPTGTSVVNLAMNPVGVAFPRTITSASSLGGVNTLYFRIRDNAGCWSEASSGTVTIYPSPAVPTINPSVTVACNTIPLTFASITGGNIYRQLDSVSTKVDSVILNSIITLSKSGTYYFKTRSADGCWSPKAASRKLTIDRTPAVPAKPTITASACGVLTLTSAVAAPQGTKFYWQTTNTGVSTEKLGQFFIANGEGTVSYFVRLKSDTANCWSGANSDEFTISVSSVPSPIVSNLRYVQNDPSQVLTVTAVAEGIKTNWYTDSTAAAILELAPTPPTSEIGIQTYYVTHSKGNCESPRIPFIVNVIEAIIEMKANIGITPNEDGTNDALVIDYINNFPNNSITILDKWGNIVFEEKKYTNSFKGKKDGNDLPTGTYYYVLNLGNDSKPQSGSLTIIR